MNYIFNFGKLRFPIWRSSCSIRRCAERAAPVSDFAFVAVSRSVFLSCLGPSFLPLPTSVPKEHPFCGEFYGNLTLRPHCHNRYRPFPACGSPVQKAKSPGPAQAASITTTTLLLRIL